MPQKRDPSHGRRNVILAALAVVVLVLIAAGVVIISPPGERGRPLRPGEDSAARHSRSPDLFEEEGLDEARPGQARPQDGVKTSTPAGQGRETSEPRPADSRGKVTGTDEAADVVDPEEISGPAKGHLIIRVTDRADDRPVIGASVYFPMRETNLESEGGEIRLLPGMAEAVKRTNRHGVAVWKESELNKLPGSGFKTEGVADTGVARLTSSSVVVTAPGYADLFETVAVPAPDPRGSEIALKLSSAVRVSGKCRLKRGGNAAHVRIEVRQSSRQGVSANPANGFTVVADSLGEFQLKVANDYLYQFAVKHSGYAPYLSQVFDFRRDEREVSIVLEPAQGIEGIVTDKSGRSIAGATVTSVQERLGVETDSEGRFVFDLVKDRIYSNDIHLRITAAGYAPLSRQVLANDRNVKIELSREGTLKGVVVNEKGKPVMEARVTCRYMEGREEIFSTESNVDSEGNFSFAGFGRGEARLIAHTQDGLSSEVAQVKVAPETEAGPVQLKLTTAAAITGQVRVRGGGGIEKVTLALNGKPVASTDAEGNFSIAALDAGEHSLKVVNQYPIEDGQLRQLPLFTTDGKAFYYLPAERKLKLKLGASEAVIFECDPFEARFDRTITLRIVTVPAETATAVVVTINPVFGAPPAGIEMPKPYAFPVDIPDGRLETQSKLLNGVSYEVTFVHPRYFTATLNHQALAQVKDGETVEVRLERAFMIKGYVKDSQGNGLEGVGLSKDPNNKWAQSATTDIHGYFEFGQMKEGDYVISAFKTSYYLEQKEVRIQGRDPDLLQIQLISANEIRIVVMNNGQPQPGARCHIYRNENDSSNPDDWKVHFDIGTTDANGVKVINFHWQRNYQVVALHGSRIGYVNFDNLRETPSREVTLSLEPAYQLSGQVVDAQTGAPVPEAFVRAHIEPTGVEGKDGNLFQTQSNSAGSFSLTVPAGMYHFYVPQSTLYRRLDTTGSPVPQGTTGISLAVQLRDDIQGNYAQMVSFSCPATMTAGQEYEISVTVRNSGSTTWSAAGANPWRLGSQAPQDNNTWNVSRVNIAAGVEVRPGDSYTFTFNVRAPAKPGQYNMQWRMVQEGVQWFGQYTPLRQVTVVAASGG
ncbi:MAG: hypothetical protein BroJett014_28470 [Planctomycetota bacterium]|nr:hypothetical protein [Planctomycetota bacterium]GIK53874.1 MAG: hypothetical protein BroJett014_28470 [Planctomycetota bacterium]